MKIIGWTQMPEVDKDTLRKIIVSRLKKDMRVLELGSWVGGSTVVILKEIIKVGGSICVVDTWGGEGSGLRDHVDGDNVKKCFDENTQGYAKHITCYHMTTTQAAKEITEKFDIVFIDASHLYDDIKNDLDNYVDKVKPGGLIFGHDFESFEYDEAHINIDFVDGKHHGVVKAVTEKFGDKAKQDGNFWVVEL